VANFITQTLELWSKTIKEAFKFDHKCCCWCYLKSFLFPAFMAQGW